MLELLVILKDEERTYRQKFLVYEPVSMTPESPDILDYIVQAKEGFGGDPDSVSIKTTMVIQ